MKKFIKRIFKPISYIFTKLLFDIDVIKPHIKKVFWEESNAFKWSSSYVVKNQIEGDYLEFGVWKGNSFIEAISSECICFLSYSDCFGKLNLPNFWFYTIWHLWPR